MKYFYKVLYLLMAMLIVSCSSDENETVPEEVMEEALRNLESIRNTVDPLFLESANFEDFSSDEDADTRLLYFDLESVKVTKTE